MERNDRNGHAPRTQETPLSFGRTLLISQDRALCDGTQSACIAVYDDRRTGNPSFRVMRSYCVMRPARMREILLALIAYDRADPVSPPWNRTLPSLMREWRIHNIAYRLGMFREQSRDVDLDNREEGKNWSHYVRRGVGIVARRVRAALHL